MNSYRIYIAEKKTHPHRIRIVIVLDNLFTEKNGSLFTREI